MQQYIKWSKEELEYLRHHYSTTTTATLSSNLKNRSFNSIICKARSIGVHKNVKFSDPSSLLQETPEAYYWIGFLMADGGFTDRRINVKIQISDLPYLKKFAKFIHSTNFIKTSNNCCQLRIASVDEVRALREKFSISSRKTYEPCNIRSIKNADLLFSLIIGFIDGDGCISKNKNSNSYRLSVVGHPMWLNNFSYMKSHILSYCGFKDTTKRAYIKDAFTSLPQDITKTKKHYKSANFYISQRKVILAIRKKAEELKLPFMERKLGKVIDSPFAHSPGKTTNWNIISPNGAIFKSFGLKSFCKEHNLSKSQMYNVTRGKLDSWMGWKVYKD